jgi:protein Mpv17
MKYNHPNDDENNNNNYNYDSSSTKTVVYRIKPHDRTACLGLRVVFLYAVLLIQERPSHQQFSSLPSSSSLLRSSSSLFTNSFSLQIPPQNRGQFLHHKNGKRNHRRSRTTVFQSSVGVDANGSTGASISSGSSSSHSHDDLSSCLPQQQQQLSQQQVVGTAVETPIQAISLQNERHEPQNHEEIDASVAALGAEAATAAATIDKSIDEVLTDNELLRKNIFNALLLGLTFGYAAYTIFNIDHGMTRGWTQSEIAMRIPLDNWLNYESSLTDRPIATKTAINVIIYLLGDWLSQTAFSGNHILNFNAARTIRNGFIGLCFGPLVHEYYQFSDHILPVDGGMFVRLQKIIMDQTIYLSVKCSIYISAVGLLQGDDIATVKQNVQTKLPNIVLTAWKFWPLVHLVTYGVIPARHRILWVNCVDLIWNAILATMSQKKTGEDTDTDDSDSQVSSDTGGDNNSILPPLIYEATLSDESFTSVSIIESSADASTSAAATLTTEVDLDLTRAPNKTHT